MKNESKKEQGLSESAQELSAQELDMLRSRLGELEDRSAIPPPERKKQNKLIKFAKNNIVATVVIAVLFIALIATLVLVGVYFSAGSEQTGDYLFVYGEGSRAEKIKVGYGECVINDVLYIDMNKVAEFAGLAVSGSEESMKYIASGEQYVKFTNESGYAVVNMSRIVLPEGQTAIVGGGKCLVPYQVLIKLIEGGITFKIDQSERTVSIKRATYTEDDIIYNQDITFTAAYFEVAKTAVYEYDIDVGQYLNYIDPEDSSPYLLLVSPTSPLGEDYVPNGLEKIPAAYTAIGAEYEMVECARQALVAMMREMYDDLAMSAEPYVTSAYRSYARQNELFEGYVKDHMRAGLSREDAELEVLKTSARPGTSEHQSGLCVDLMTVNMTSLDNSFEQTAAFAWLSENAYKFGFILRYPAHKGDIVAHDYESWHYRFVGRDAATEMYLSDMCLEEYLGIIMD